MSSSPEMHGNSELEAKQIADAKVPSPDDILQAVVENGSFEETLTEEDAKRILRRIDLHLLPVLFLSYMSQYLDKSAMGYTAILGLRKDLKLVGQDYSWASSIFYFGYLVGSYPAAYFLVRVPLGKGMSTAVITWAAIVMLTATCTGPQGLMAARFFLGFVESAIAPGMTMFISMWYKRSEQPLRHAAWFMGNVTGGLVGGLLAYGLGHITSIAPWKAIFLIFGSATVLWGMLMYFLIPDTPLKARFLSKTDQLKAVGRVQDNMTGMKNQTWKKYQFVEALTDPKAWLLALFQFSQNLPNGAVGPFASIVVEGLGFSTFGTLLIQMAGTGFQAIFVLIATYGSTRFPNTRTYWMFLMTLIGLIGAICIRQLPSEQIWARFFAGYCFFLAFSANFPLTMAMITSNTGGFTKKTCVSAMVFVGYCVGNISGPHVMFAKESPSYPSGFAAIIVCFSGSAAVVLALRFYLIWANKKRDSVSGPIDSSEASHMMLNLIDKTDGELQEFRYVY